MLRIFISDSWTDNAQAIAPRDWLFHEAWDDLFLDLDPERGIAAGERWERALNGAARQCEVVLFLIRKALLGLAWRKNELNVARWLTLASVLSRDLRAARTDTEPRA